jgi:hypothetical protein
LFRVGAENEMNIVLPAIDLVQQPLEINHSARSGARDHKFHSSPFTGNLRSPSVGSGR